MKKATKKPATATKPKPAPAAAPAAPAKEKASAPKPTAAKPKRMSGLDAAAAVLADSKEPLGCGEIFDRILKRKLWATKGKTPAATLSAAILREVKVKGKESRFKKVGRGRFAMNSGAR
jgi:hypothetical protein